MNRNAYLVLAALVLVAGAVEYTHARPNGRGGAQAKTDEKIEVTEASYGKNRRNDQAGNATQYLKDACDGKRTCSFPVSQAANKIGDHSPGQTKDFDYVYLCGDREKKGHVEGEAVGKTALLTCAN